MSQFVKQRIRCKLKPSRWFEPFLLKLTGTNIKTAKAGSCQWELTLFDDDDTLFDVSNVASLTVQITDSAGTVVASKTVTQVASSSGSITPGITLEQWNAGTHQHATILFSSSEMNFDEANYEVQVYGFTSDESSENDPFGIATLEHTDMFMNAGAVAVVPGKVPVYAEDIAGLLAGVIRTLNAGGVTIKLVSPDGSHSRTIGINNDGAPTDDIV